MESEDFRLASSYHAMSGSPAYLHLIDWLEKQCKKAELLVATVPVSDKDNYHIHFLSWQRLVEVTQSIKNVVEIQCEFKEITEKELKENERPHSDIDAGHDTSLPGYRTT